MRRGMLVVAAALLVCWMAGDAAAQINSLTREELIKYTAPNPFDRFPDGRPRVPETLFRYFQNMSSEEVMNAGQAAPPAAPGRAAGPQPPPAVTYTDGWQILSPGKKLIGRAFTLQLMPIRHEVADVDQAEWKQKGNELRLSHQSALDMLQEGDVLVVDAGGNMVEGIIGNNLAYYIWKKTGTGFVIDGAIRDLESIAAYGMPGYYRKAGPPWITTLMVTGINVPIRIGQATVMPGDLVFGDREGVNFIPPQAVQRLVDPARSTEYRDEWIQQKFSTGKYKSTDIYSQPRDPALRQEMQEYIKKRMAENP